MQAAEQTGQNPRAPSPSSSSHRIVAPFVTASTAAQASETSVSLGDSQDPRVSSTQSLVPSLTSTNERRTLLLIYCHGFMGDETSFQRFPAHVHNLVKVLLAESHVVHTKIYPRYRSRKAIQIVTEAFSTWLAPHESPEVDVILLGHSMGGILAAEVELLQPKDPTAGRFRHRLVGTINLDVPFLGMHPSVIKAGLGSLFRPATPPPKPQSSLTSLTQESTTSFSSSTTASTATSSLSTDSALFDSGPPDPNYNPPFPNDIRLPVRTGWRSARHFFNKHSSDLARASQAWLTSHYEFGAVLADYAGLKARYCKVRMLEEEDPAVRASVLADARPAPPRVRFANYYTVSTGRPKKAKPPKPDKDAASEPSQDDAAASTPEPDTSDAAAPEADAPDTASALDTPDTQPAADASHDPSDDDAAAPAAPPTQASSAAPPKHRTFCVLPPATATGARDVAWIPLLMENMDTVEAHTSLFFEGSEAYARLVGDVAGRVEAWVAEELSVRAAGGLLE